MRACDLGARVGKGSELFENVTFVEADLALRERVLHSRRSIYGHEFGFHGVDRFDESAHHLVALDETGQILAGMRILTTDPAPLEIEQFVELSSIKLPGRCVAQIGGFWVLPEHRRGRGAMLPLAMMRYAVEFGTSHGITDYVLRTHVQRLQRLYERASFRIRDDLAFDHPDWGTVFVMHLDFSKLKQRSIDGRDPVARFLWTGTRAGI